MHPRPPFRQLLIALAVILPFLAMLTPPDLRGANVPPGFTETIISGPSGGTWNEAVGIAFEENGRMYVWERTGFVWFKDPADPSFSQLLNISQEVGHWEDHGLLGFALDPDFRVNGYIYLLYVVDRHHLLNFGTGSYNPTANQYNAATIGRVTRYTCRSSDGFRSVDPSSRFVLIGETKQTGFPMISYTHGIGSLVFGEDGTLLISCGDAATADTADPGGSVSGSYSSQALADGILRTKEDIGAYRSQLVDCLNGKIVRIDPATGDGLPSNPYYDPANPRSPRSRVWVLGLRNPFRMILKPESGNHDPAAGNPGSLYVGDVGWNEFECLKVVTAPRQNFGWPLYEGLEISGNYNGAVLNRDAPNPLYPGAGCSQFFAFRDLLKEDSLDPAAQPPFVNPCNTAQRIPGSIPQFLHARPVLDWAHTTASTRTPIFGASGQALIANLGAPNSPVAGAPFSGNCAVGGTWYTGTLFPAEYRDSYYFADWGQGIIKRLTFNQNQKPVALSNFLSNAGAVVCVVQHPSDGSLYYVSYTFGDAGTVRKLSYTGNRTPVPFASADQYYGPGPLSVQFSSSGSSEPDGQAITYSWNFGDGSPASTQANPSHTFSAPPGVPTKFTVTLTITDTGGLSAQTSLIISVNNTPPNVTITSPADGSLYSMSAASTFPLTATVGDGESSNSQLAYLWQVLLHHNEHNHVVLTHTNSSASAVISPVGCDGINIYYYRVVLTVTDPAGLSTTREVRLFPDCGTADTPPIISDIPNQTTLIGATAGPLPFTIGDAQTSAANLQLSSVSSNPGLVPPSAIVFGGSESNRTVTITPAANQTGTATITVNVTDGPFTTSDSFVLTVTGVNTPPSISGIADQSTLESTPVGPVGFTVSDTETVPGSLSLSAGSSNPGLVPTNNITFGGSGSNRTVSIMPAPNQSGVSTITVTVRDGELTASTSFALTVSGQAPSGTRSFTNTALITIPGLGNATPYPSTINVSGMGGALSNITVTLRSLTHTWPADVDVLLVGPGGQKAMIFSDVGGGNNVNNVTVTLSDSASAVLTAGGQIAAGTYRPTDVEPGETGNLDSFPAPAPGGPYTSQLSVFNGQSANGIWSLYVVDDGPGDQGSFAGGWSVTMTTVSSGPAAPTISDIANQFTTVNTPTAAIPFTVGDVDTPIGNLTLNKGSSNPVLVPTNNIVFGGTGANRTVTVTPAAGQTGTATITVTVSDGSLSASDTFVLTVNTVNTIPTISDITDQTVNEDTATTALAFTIGDGETAAGSLTLGKGSSNPTLVPTNNIVFGGSGGNRTLTVTPAANQSGTSTITVTVSDGQLTATDTFVVTVNAVNDLPTISNIIDQNTSTGTAVGPLSFTVGDAETAVGSLTLSAGSSNPTLVPTSNIVFGGSGANRTVTVTPAAGENGASTITVVVSDGTATANDTFVLNVTSQALGLVAAYGFNEGTGSTVTDFSPNGNTGTINGATWAAAGKFGQALSFDGDDDRVTVNNAPSLNLTTAMTLEAWVRPTAIGWWRDVIYKGVNDIYFLMASSNEDTPAVGGAFAGGDARGTTSLPLNTWTHLAGTYDGAMLRLYVNGVQVGTQPQTGSITTSTGPLTIGGDPLYGQYFAGQIDEVRVYNRALSAAEVQTDMNTPVGSAPPAAPTITDIANQVTTVNTPTPAIPFTVGDTDTPLTSLTLSKGSSNPTLVPTNSIVFGGSGANRTVTITPAAGQSGTSTITVAVNDGALSASDTFVLTVSAVNTAPTISDITDQSVNEDTATAAVAFTIGDAETAAGSLTLGRASSNPTLVPTNNIVFGGSGANRTVTITPAANQSGTSTITVTVSDGQLSASDTFVLTVNAVNDVPTISDIADRAINEDTATAALALTIGDVETAAASLTLSAGSSNPTLVPTNNIVFGGSGANRIVTVTPAANQNGTSTITVTVGDGTGSASDTFVLTVNAVNDVPTISDIADQEINEDTATTALALTVGDAETAAASLTLNAGSSNPVLVPTNNIVFGGSGANRTVTITPAANQDGTSTITVTVDDGTGIVSDTFLLTVNAVNDVPMISDIADQATNEDTATAALAFTIGDVETAAASLTLSAGSSNPVLVPTNNIVFGGSGANRTMTITPAANQNGTSTITVTVDDGTGTVSDIFLLTVNAVNDVPTISDIADQATNEDMATAALPFTIGDVETAAASLTLSAGSSNPVLVPTNNIVFGGSGANRIVTVTPAANQSGTSTITVTVGDGTGSASDTFVLTVNAVNDVPTISDIADQEINEDTATTALALTIGDAETAAASLTLSAGSSNPTLVPTNNIAFGGSGANRTVTVTPAANQSGTSIITLTVSDGTANASNTLFLTVNAVNDVPTISDLADQSTTMGTSTGPISFTVGDVETAPGSLTLSAGSSNPALVPTNTIVFAGSGANPTVTVTPSAGQTGTSTITVTVSDGGLSASDTFVLTVSAGNTAPTVSDIADQSVNEDTAAAALAFTIGDAETAAGSLTLGKGSSNPTLVPTNNIVFAGSGGNRTVTVTPAANQSGTSTITVTVSDGQLSASDTFVLTVNAINDVPTISDIADQATNEDTAIAALAFTIGDVETAAASLTLSAGSSNPTLVPTNNIVFGGSGANRTVTITPAANQNGTSTITVTVDDGTGIVSDTFLLTVNAINDVPTISDIGDQATNEDTATAALAFTIGDVETAAASLTLSAGSSNPVLVPTNNIVFGGSGANRTVTITPAANQSGTSTITVTVSDGQLSASDTFVLTVNAINDVPTISDIADQATNEDTATAALAFTIGDVETAAASLTLNAGSSNPVLVPTNNIVFGGSEANRTVTITPAANQNGTSTITVTVGDGTGTASDTFLLTVNTVNDAPTISNLADQNTTTGTAAGPISFTIGDVETAPGSLILTKGSSNPTVVPTNNIVFGGSGANRTVTVTPAAGQTGTSTITVTVSDGTLPTSDTFVLNVSSQGQTAAKDSLNVSGINQQVGHQAGLLEFAVRFTAQSSYTAINVGLWLKKVGNPTFNIRARLWNSSGQNIGSLIDSSDFIPASSLTTSYAEVLFTGNLSAPLTNGGTYWISLECSAAGSSANYIHWQTAWSGAARMHYDYSGADQFALWDYLESSFRLYAPNVADTTAPSAPVGLTANPVSASQINVSWGSSSDDVGVSGYRVERCGGSGCNNFAEVASPTGTSYNDTGLSANTSYSYRVRAVDGAGNLSGYSAETSVTTPAPAQTSARDSLNVSGINQQLGHQSGLSELAVRFTAQSSYTAINVGLWLKKVGNPTFNIRARLWNSSGQNVGSLIDSSDFIPASSLTTSYAEILFTGNLSAPLTNGGTYWISLECSATGNSANHIHWQTAWNGAARMHYDHSGADQFALWDYLESSFRLYAPVTGMAALGSASLPTPRIQQLPEGRIELQFDGDPGTAYSIDASTDLTRWQTVKTLVCPTNGMVTFRDEDASSYPRRFYRVRR